MSCPKRALEALPSAADGVGPTPFDARGAWSEIFHARQVGHFHHFRLGMLSP